MEQVYSATFAYSRASGLKGFSAATLIAETRYNRLNCSLSAPAGGRRRSVFY